MSEATPCRSCNGTGILSETNIPCPYHSQDPETYNDMQREVGRLISRLPLADNDVKLNLIIMLLCAEIDKLKVAINAKT